MTSAVIAVDPGIKGAVAALYEGEFVSVRDLPIEAKKSGRNQIDVRGLMQLFEDVAFLLDARRRKAGKVDLVTYCLIEQVAAMPGQGVSGMFSLGDSFGAIRGVATFYSHRVAFVAPGVWKRAMGLTKNKDYSLTCARAQFPLAAPELMRKKDEGRAEALLLAKYGAAEFKW